eukprot:scaffold11127_cov55-Phaeocystis_antarctica.AAC.3
MKQAGQSAELTACFLNDTLDQTINAQTNSATIHKLSPRRLRSAQIVCCRHCHRHRHRPAAVGTHADQHARRHDAPPV